MDDIRKAFKSKNPHVESLCTLYDAAVSSNEDEDWSDLFLNCLCALLLKRGLDEMYVDRVMQVQSAEDLNFMLFHADKQAVIDGAFINEVFECVKK